MGACGCNDITPYHALKINGNKYVVFEKYNGCRYCDTGIGAAVYFFDKTGFEEWVKERTVIPEIVDITFDFDGGSSQHYLFFDPTDFVKSCKEHGISDDDILGIWDYETINIVQRAMEISEERMRNVMRK